MDGSKETVPLKSPENIAQVLIKKKEDNDLKDIMRKKGSG